MRYFRKITNDKEISRRSSISRVKLEAQLYQDYLRKNLIDTEENNKNIDMEHLENVFTNEIYYRAMKNLLPNEKKVLYLSYYENWILGDVCKILGMSRKEVIELKARAINHFKKNVQRYQLILKKGGANNG